LTAFRKIESDLLLHYAITSSTGGEDYFCGKLWGAATFWDRMV